MMVMLVSEVKDYDKELDSKEWIAELKRDGNRLQIRYERNELGTGLQIFNRKGELYTKDIPKIIKKSFLDNIQTDDYVQSMVLDGEITYTDIKGIDHRTQAQCKEAEPLLWVWDCIELNGEDLTSRTWAERKEELKTITSIYQWTYEDDSNIRYLPHYMDKRGLLKVAEENNMEGIVLKKVDSTYEEGKSKNQIKVKFAQTDDFIVVGYCEANEFSTNTKGEQINNKRFPYFKALLLAQYKCNCNDDKCVDNVLVSKGKVGGGFNDDNVEQMTTLLKKNDYQITLDNLSAPQTFTGIHNFIDKDFGLSKNKAKWLDVDDWFVIEVKMHGLTEYGNPFQPRFLTLRDDKKIEECVEK